MSWWAEQAHLLRLAVQLLTRVPVRSGAPRPGDLAHCLRYAPLVGAGIGLVGAAVLRAGAGLPPLLAAVLAVATTVLLTGGLHEDGLADSCDGLFGGRTRADALRIMKDSRIGVFGALGLGLVTAGRIAAIAVLPGSALVAAHVVSRLCMTGAAAALPPARPDGVGAPVSGGPGLAGWMIAGATVVLAAPAGRLGWMLAACGLTTAAATGWLRRRIGGYTGDTLGAVQQATELLVYGVLVWHAA